MRFIILFGLVLIAKCINQDVLTDKAIGISIFLAISFIMDLIEFANNQIFKDND